MLSFALWETAMQKSNSQLSAKQNKRASRIRFIVFTALMTALTTVLTIASVPLATGYYNFGDIPIFMSASLLGPLSAVISGAIGAMLGDVILGYTAYAPFTLIIKALEGLVAGLLFKVISKLFKKEPVQAILCALGNIAGGILMALGYFLAEGLLLAEDSWTGGIANLPFNILQGVISAIVAVVLLYVCRIKMLFNRIFRKSELQRPQNDTPKENGQTDTNNADIPADAENSMQAANDTADSKINLDEEQTACENTDNVSNDGEAKQ